MTTRAGLTGLLTGLIATIVLYLIFIPWYNAVSNEWMNGIVTYAWAAAAVLALLAVGGGWFAAKWNRSVLPGRNAALGALSGGLAGAVLFCLWGAAVAGMLGSVITFDSATGQAVQLHSQAEIIGGIVRRTMETFLLLFLGGSVLGFAGGWLACPHKRGLEDVFNKEEPQMAMNASITAVPASAVAMALCAGVFPRLAELVGGQKTLADMPLLVSLLLVLVSQFALSLVIPHEARQSEHRCGMNEVKMGAYVGIATAPVTFLFLELINAAFLSYPLVIAALLASTLMSLIMLRTLLKLILPKRSTFSVPKDDRKKMEANLFGTIAVSHGPRLVILCAGCGLLMVLPIYVCVLSVLINLANAPAITYATQSLPALSWELVLKQALTSTGVIIASVVALSLMYLFYLNLGRWFSRWNTRRT